MATAILEDARPPMWQIEPTNSVPAREVLHFGRHRIALADITAVSGESERTRPINGLMLAAAIFMISATLITFGVFEGQWRARYLIGAIFLAFLGGAGILELTKVRQQRLFRVHLTLRNGEVVTFASTDHDDAERLMARVAPKD